MSEQFSGEGAQVYEAAYRMRVELSAALGKDNSGSSLDTWEQLLREVKEEWGNRLRGEVMERVWIRDRFFRIIELQSNRDNSVTVILQDEDSVRRAAQVHGW
jgi:hypothetical protein